MNAINKIAAGIHAGIMISILIGIPVFAVIKDCF